MTAPALALEHWLKHLLEARDPQNAARQFVSGLGAFLAIDAAALAYDGLPPGFAGLLVWRREQPAEVEVVAVQEPLGTLAARAVNELALPAVYQRPLSYRDRTLGLLLVTCRQPWSGDQVTDQNARLDQLQKLGALLLANGETFLALDTALRDTAALFDESRPAPSRRGAGGGQDEIGVGRPLTRPRNSHSAPVWSRWAGARDGTILEHTRAGHFRSTLAGEFITASTPLARLLGYATPAALRASCAGFGHCLAEPARFSTFLQELGAGDRVRAAEFPARTRDGRPLCLSVTAQAIRDPAEATAHVDALVEEITERKQVEERLRLLSAAFAAAANGIVITSRDGVIVSANPAFARLTGYSLEEILGHTPRLLRSDQQTPSFYRSLWSTITSGQIWQGALVNRRKDGSLYTEEMTIAPIRQENGEISHFVAIKQDVSERKRIEAAEREHRALAEALVDTAAALNSSLASDGVLDRILDNVGRVVPYEVASIVMFGEGAAPTVRCRWAAESDSPSGRLARATATGDRPQVWRIARSGQSVRIPAVSADPAWRDAPEMAGVGSHLSTPIISRGQVLGLLTLDNAQRGFYTHQHAGRLQAFVNQAAIALENARLYQMLRQRAADIELLYHASVGLLDTSQGVPALAQHIVTTVAHEFPHARCAVLLLDAEGAALIPQAQTDVANVSPAWALSLDSQDPAAIAAQTGASVYVPYAAQDGEASAGRPFTAALAIPLHSGNRLLGVLSLHSRQDGGFDERARHFLGAYAGRAALALDNAQLLTRLSQALEAAEAASRLKSEFLAVLSHELRTPLAHILGSLRLVLDGLCQTPDEEGAFLRTGYEAGQHLLGLVNDILGYARIEAGQVSMEFQPVDIATCLEEMRQLVGPWAHSKGLQFIVRYPPEAALSAWVDPDRLQQALLQVARNAVKFTEQGSVTLTGGLDSTGTEVWITVEDTGIGLPADRQAELFKPFVQGDASSTRRFGGIGLGLSIASRLTQLMNGRLTAHSAGPGLGSAFTLTFPACPAP